MTQRLKMPEIDTPDYVIGGTVRALSNYYVTG
jgi:hypothetical protein